MLSLSKRRQLLEGDTRGGRLPLINSIRRGGLLETKEKQSKQLSSARSPDYPVYFPQEYGTTLSNEAKSIQDIQQAGVVNLQVHKDRGTADTSDRKIMIAGQEIQLKKGSLRILDKDIIDGLVERSAQDRETIDALLGVILEGGTQYGDNIARYILDVDEFKHLNKSADNPSVFGAGASSVKDYSGHPSVFLSFPPSSKDFQLGLHKLRLVLEKSSSFFDEPIGDWKKKYGNSMEKLVRTEAN